MDESRHDAVMKVILKLGSSRADKVFEDDSERFTLMCFRVQLAASMLISAASAALAVDLIARKGQSIWPTWCNYTSRFCDYAQGAIIASFIGFYFLALSTLLAASALRYLARRRHL